MIYLLFLVEVLALSDNNFLVCLLQVLAWPEMTFFSGFTSGVWLIGLDRVNVFILGVCQT